MNAKIGKQRAQPDDMMATGGLMPVSDRAKCSFIISAGQWAAERNGTERCVRMWRFFAVPTCSSSRPSLSHRNRWIRSDATSKSGTTIRTTGSRDGDTITIRAIRARRAAHCSAATDVHPPSTWGVTIRHSRRRKYRTGSGSAIRANANRR